MFLCSLELKLPSLQNRQHTTEACLGVTSSEPPPTPRPHSRFIHSCLTAIHRAATAEPTTTTTTAESSTQQLPLASDRESESGHPC